MNVKHACRLVPRFLYPRWDRPRRVRAALEFCRQIGADELMLFPTGQMGQMTTFSYFETLGGLTFGEHVQAWAEPRRPFCRPAQGVYGDLNRTGLYYGLAQTMWPLLYRIEGDLRQWVGLINFAHDVADDVTCWVNRNGRARVRYVDARGRLQPISPRDLVHRDGRVGIALRSGHRVRPFDTLLLVVEPG